MNPVMHINLRNVEHKGQTYLHMNDIPIIKENQP